MDSDILFCTLSVGKNYTKDYTCKLTQDILQNTKCRIAITTDFPDIITSTFPDEPRILLDVFNRSNYKLRLPTDKTHYSHDFNFNVRYTALRQCIGQPEKYIFFTDCDNSLSKWNSENVYAGLSWLSEHGYEFMAPRSSLLLSNVINDYLTNVSPTNKTPNSFWHKIHAFDLIYSPHPEWDNAPVPTEYFFVLANKDNKLNKFYEGWKFMHDWLASLPYTHGTWAEGIEIGIASVMAGYKPYDIGFDHRILDNVIEASGHKVGHATSGITEEN